MPDGGTRIELPVPSYPSRRRLERGIYQAPSGRLCIFYTCSGCTVDGCPNGHWETLPAGSPLQDARELRAQKLADVSRGTRVVGTRVRFRAFTEEWLESVKPIEGVRGRYRQGTWELYKGGLERHVLPKMGRLMLSEITVDDCARVIRVMQHKGLKAHTIRNVMKPMSVLFAAAVRRGLMQVNPMLQLEREERPRNDQRRMQILSTEEIARLLPAVPEHWRLLISFLVFTGLRVSEALNVCWEDIDFKEGTVLVRQSKTEAGTGRRVILMPGLANSLKESRSALRGPVFLKRGSPEVLTRRHVRSILRDATTRAGVTDVTVHELRHTFASILISQKEDKAFIADQMGHAHPGITDALYGHLFDPDERRAKARARLEASFGGVL